MMKLQVKAGLILSFFLCMETGFCVNAQEPVFEKDEEVEFTGREQQHIQPEGKFPEWNCESYDCTHLGVTDFKELLARPILTVFIYLCYSKYIKK